MAQQNRTASIFDIQRFSIHDGPGIRTVVFFKGCTLNCDWCQNPESKKVSPQIHFNRNICIDCYKCPEYCPRKSLQIIEKKITLDFNNCNNCGECTEICPSAALKMVGESSQCESLLESCLRDISFYKNSGGGVTISGGEAVLHADFLLDFLPALKKKGVHILLETAGYYQFDKLRPLLPYLDHLYFDLKLMSESKHLKHTGHSNRLILENLTKLINCNANLTIRIPVIPGINTTKEEILFFAKYLHTLHIEEIHLLKYNELWKDKLKYLGVPPMNLSINIGKDYRYEFKELLQHYNIAAIFPETAL